MSPLAWDLGHIAAYEDLRHLLKHKRSYAPEALTPRERKILAKKSFAASLWLATGKKVYRAITRGLFNFTDREGGGNGPGQTGLDVMIPFIERGQPVSVGPMVMASGTGPATLAGTLAQENAPSGSLVSW